MRPLDPDRWRTLSPYLDQVLEIDPAERDAWVAALSKTHSDIAADLQVLLQEHRAMADSGFLEDTIDVDVDHATPSMAGQVLGAYRLLSLIGQGGMGSVWLA